ncbi:MAG: phage minor head protein [Bryobacteraceae bacterium]
MNIPRAGRVYDSERAAALRYNHDIDYAVKLARVAALRLLRRMRVSAETAFRTHRGIAHAMRPSFDALKPIIASAMIYSYLRGMQRSAKETGVTTKALILDDRTLAPAIRHEVGRFNLSAADIARLQAKVDPLAGQVVEVAEEEARRVMAETMQRITSEGMHVREGVAELRKTFDSLGLAPAKPYQLETILRTQSQLAYAGGNGMVYKQAAVDEILWGYKYVTAGDDRVREEHVLMDGTTLPKDDSFWDWNSPPCGFNCRCVKIPIFEARDPVRPIPAEIGGRLVYPQADEGFRFDPGRLLAA